VSGYQERFGCLDVKEKAMNNNDTMKRLTKDIQKPLLYLSDSKQVNKFYLQVGTEPYCQLGTGKRCKVKGCGQPVYCKEAGLCSYHRMMEAERVFENRLRTRQQKPMMERK
jgi:hypothetical protein